MIAVVAKLVGVKGVVNAVSGLGVIFSGEKMGMMAKGILEIMRFSHHRKGVKVIFQNQEDKDLFLGHRIVKESQCEFIKGLGVDLNVFKYVPEQESDGFSPQKGELDPSKIRRGNSLPATKVKLKYDPLKEEYIRKMIDKVAGSKLYFVVSPIWYGMDTLQFQPVKEICREWGIPFIDYSNDTKYVHQDKWFKDGNHMNERGADEFTMDLVKFLW